VSSSAAAAPRPGTLNGGAERAPIANGSDSSDILSFLNGTWRSVEYDKIVVLNGWVRFQEGGGMSGPQRISIIAGRGGDIFALQLNGWHTNGVKAGVTEIVWTLDNHQLSPLTWTRVGAHAETADTLLEAIDSAEKDTQSLIAETMIALMEKSAAKFAELRHQTRQATRGDLAPMCKICMDKPIGVVLLGCGHTLCTVCAEEQCQVGKKCFVCKIPYGGKQPIFFS